MNIKKGMLGIPFILSMLMATSSAHAVTMIELGQGCGGDKDKYCANVAHGDPLKACLTEQKNKLSETCKPLIERLNNGESVTFF
jgi:hypothetical protein